jgi:hypothetical protein
VRPAYPATSIPGPCAAAHLHSYRPPDYCPLTSRHFAELDRALRREPALYPKTRLLSISIDPEYDRPAVLRKYGLTYTDAKGPNPFDQWELATGSPLAAGPPRRIPPAGPTGNVLFRGASIGAPRPAGAEIFAVI